MSLTNFLPNLLVRQKKTFVIDWGIIIAVFRCPTQFSVVLTKAPPLLPDFSSSIGLDKWFDALVFQNIDVAPFGTDNACCLRLTGVWMDCLTAITHSPTWRLSSCYQNQRRRLFRFYFNKARSVMGSRPTTWYCIPGIIAGALRLLHLASLTTWWLVTTQPLGADRWTPLPVSGRPAKAAHMDHVDGDLIKTTAGAEVQCCLNKVRGCREVENRFIFPQKTVIGFCCQHCLAWFLQIGPLNGIDKADVMATPSICAWQYKEQQ